MINFFKKFEFIIYNTRDIMRCVKKNNNKMPNNNANNNKADDGELVDNMLSTGPPVISSVKLTGEYTPNKTNAIRSARKTPR